MKFYDCTPAPSPRRVRIFLAEKGIELETVQVDLMNAENLGAEYRKINPRGLVPTLQLDDGSCIDESMAICRYFEETHPEPPLFGTDAKSRAVIESVNRCMEMEGLQSVADAFRNTAPSFAKRGLQGVDEDVPAIPALAERGLGGIRRYFDRLETLLADHAFVAGDQFSVADSTAMVTVDFAGWVKQRVPQGNANTQRWYAAVSARPSAKA